MDQIEANEQQPRQAFDEAKLAELAASIAEHGVVQPVLVRREDEGYRLVAGERRWRAARMAGLAAVPAVVRSVSDAGMMEIALIENLQREDLNPVEEALAYRRLLDEFGLTQQKLAQRLGQSRPQISNTLRLLRLPEPVLEMLQDGRLTVGHGKVLLGAEDSDVQLDLARDAVDAGLSVRQTEAALSRAQQDESAAERPASEAPASSDVPDDPDLAWQAVTERLESRLETGVDLRGDRDGGRITIRFDSYTELQRLLSRLGVDEGSLQ